MSDIPAEDAVSRTITLETIQEVGPLTVDEMVGWDGYSEAKTRAIVSDLVDSGEVEIVDAGPKGKFTFDAVDAPSPDEFTLSRRRGFLLGLLQLKERMTIRDFVAWSPWDRDTLMPVIESLVDDDILGMDEDRTERTGDKAVTQYYISERQDIVSDTDGVDFQNDFGDGRYEVVSGYYSISSTHGTKHLNTNGNDFMTTRVTVGAHRDSMEGTGLSMRVESSTGGVESASSSVDMTPKQARDLANRLLIAAERREQGDDYYEH